MKESNVSRRGCPTVLCSGVETRRRGSQALLDDEIVYHNIGMPASRGIEATLANVAGQWENFPATYDWEIRHLSSDGDIVLTERIDTVGRPGVSAPVPLMGVFEIHNGKIKKSGGTTSTLASSAKCSPAKIRAD